MSDALRNALSALLYATISSATAAREGATREDKRESGDAYEAAEKAIFALAALPEQRPQAPEPYTHRVYCNADHTQPLGCPMCICLKPERAVKQGAPATCRGEACESLADDASPPCARCPNRARMP